MGRSLVPLLLLCACAGRATAVPPATPSAAVVHERAEIHVDDASALREPDLVATAERELETPLQADIDVRKDAVAIDARGETPKQAHARCEAVVRATVAAAGAARAPSEQALADESARVHADLAAVEQSLRDVSANGGAPSPEIAAAEAVRAMMMLTGIAAPRTPADALRIAEAPELVRAFARAAAEAELDVRKLQADGLGDVHPDVRRARAAADAALARFEAQRARTQSACGTRRRRRRRAPNPARSARA